MQSKIAIEVKGLKKAYKKVQVLKNVNFKVETGTIFSLLGSNGAGKTTTIKILSTLLKLDQGTVNIHGYDVVKQPNDIHRIISLTGQYAAVDEAQTGMENLIMIGDLYHISDSKGRAKELLRYFDLLKAGDRMVSTYSGGMRRKLDIAMSLVSNPSIIFLDEPTTGLDPQSRHAMWKIIKELKETGVTIFLTTQYLEEAEQLADKIAILDKGSILVEGTGEELKKLLPQGGFDLQFQSLGDMLCIKGKLAISNMNIDEEQLRLTLCTNGTMKELSEIFNIIEEQHIEVEEFIQKRPSLEDVFLTLINEREAA